MSRIIFRSRKGVIKSFFDQGTEDIFDRRGSMEARRACPKIIWPANRPPTHPGEMLLEEFLKPLEMTQAELAEKLGVSYPRVNELIHRKRGVTPDTALRLEQLFGMEAQFWLNLQLAWDLYQAVHSPAEREIRKIKRLPALDRAVNE
jgi:addiction module HigA family antidote